MRKARRARAWRLKLDGSAVASVLIGLLLFAEILLFGGNRTDLALGFSGLWFLALALVLTGGWARSALDQARLRWIGLTFTVVLLAGFLSLTPFAIGGGHFVWTWVPGVPSIGSIDPYLTLVELVKLAALAAVFLLGVVLGSEDDRAKSLIRWLLRLGLLYSLWAFIDRVTSPASLFGSPRAFDPTRLSASLVSANTAATFFGALALLNLVDLDRIFQRYRLGGDSDMRRLERLAQNLALPSVGFAAAATCLILTLSRAGLAITAAIAIALIGAAVIARAKRGAVSAPVFAAFAILGGLVLVSLATNLGPLQERLNFLTDAAVNRRVVFAAHWAAFKAASISGYGLGSFTHVNAMVMNAANLAALQLLGAVHNVYLQWLEQAGLVGAAPMFACVGLVALKITRGAIRRRRMRSWLVGILAVLALFLIHGATDYALEVPAMATFLSLLVGLGCGMSRLRPAGAGDLQGDNGASTATAVGLNSPR